MESLERQLEKHPFTNGLKAGYVELLANIANIKRFDPGDFLLRQGHAADYLYLIQNGKVSIEAFSAPAGPLVLQTLQAGEILGWSWLVPPYEWRFDARALESTTVLAIDSKVLRQRMEEQHDLGYELMNRFLQVLVVRIEAERMKLLEAYAAHS